METTVSYKINSNSVNVGDAKALTALTLAAIEKVKEFIAHNDYKTNVPFSDSLLSEKNIHDGLVNLSRKQRKVLRNYLHGIGVKPTLSKVNRFLHHLLKVVLKSDVRIKILKSDKEIVIQEKRKAYKDAFNKMKAAHAEYKAEKGDFYKTRLANKQAF